MFKSHDGLIEITKFSDFSAWVLGHPKLVKCPDCQSEMKIIIYPSFDMDEAGKALINCKNQDCHFYKNMIKIEAIKKESEKIGLSTWKNT